MPLKCVMNILVEWVLLCSNRPSPYGHQPLGWATSWIVIIGVYKPSKRRKQVSCHGEGSYSLINSTLLMLLREYVGLSIPTVLTSRPRTNVSVSMHLHCFHDRDVIPDEL